MSRAIAGVERKEEQVKSLKEKVDAKIGKFIRVARQDHRLRLQTVADCCGMSVAKMWALEHGQSHWTDKQLSLVIAAIKSEGF